MIYHDYLTVVVAVVVLAVAVEVVLPAKDLVICLQYKLSL